MVLFRATLTSTNTYCLAKLGLSVCKFALPRRFSTTSAMPSLLEALREDWNELYKKRLPSLAKEKHASQKKMADPAGPLFCPHHSRQRYRPGQAVGPSHQTPGVQAHDPGAAPRRHSPRGEACQRRGGLGRPGREKPCAERQAEQGAEGSSGQQTHQFRGFEEEKGWPRRCQPV